MARNGEMLNTRLEAYDRRGYPLDEMRHQATHTKLAGLFESALHVRSTGLLTTVLWVSSKAEPDDCRGCATDSLGTSRPALMR